MKKKFLAYLLTLIVSFSCFGVYGGCNKPEGSSDPNVLNIKIYKGGHGTEYIQLVADKFNKLYEGQYSVEILQPSTELVASTVYKEISTGSNADIITGSTINAMDGVANKDYGQTFTDITESVLNQPAIKFDGSFEERTILEKLGDVPSDYDEKQYNGNWYLIPYVNGVGGLAVNTKVLNNYGLEIPRTTNELFAAADKIMEKASIQKVRPFTYAATGNNYAYPALLTWLSQYGGEEYYKKFMTFTDGDRELTLNEAAELFNDSPELSAVMELFVQLYDYNMQTSNVRSQTYDQAQNQFMRGNCAFYFVGDWMFNEEFTRNNKYINDITFVKPPMISALGTKVFGSETAYGFNDDLCDDILCSIIDGVDANKDKEVIESEVESALGVQLQTEDVETIIKARGMSQDRSGAGMVINYNSPKKELAALFLRFFCSTECGEMVAESIHCSSPYAVGSLKNSEYSWIKGSTSIISNKYNLPMGSEILGRRRKMGSLILFPGMGEVPVVTLTDEDHVVSIYDDETFEKTGSIKIYQDKAKYFMNVLYEDALNCIAIGKWHN